MAKLTGAGIHLRVGVPIPKSQAFDERVYEEGGFGPANFVIGEINSASMPVFVSTNVNVTVTNIAKAAAFHYEVMTNGVNAAVLDIEGDVADGTTITAPDIAILPARVKGFTGHDITLTETETKTYPVVFDFDQKGGIPIGGCDGSGNLVAAPASGTIELSFAGEPKKGRWDILRFDNANGLLNGWTVNAPEGYRYNGNNFMISVTKDPNGFTVNVARSGFMLFLK